MLLRPLVEGLINYKYIKEDVTQMRAKAFIVDDIRSRLVNIRKMVENTHSHSQTQLDMDGYKILSV